MYQNREFYSTLFLSYYRKHFLLNKELIKKKLKMKSLSKLHRRLTVSHSLYKLIGHNDLNVITRTTIALDDIADHDSVTL